MPKNPSWKSPIPVISLVDADRKISHVYTREGEILFTDTVIKEDQKIVLKGPSGNTVILSGLQGSYNVVQRLYGDTAVTDKDIYFIDMSSGKEVASFSKSSTTEDGKLVGYLT